MSNARGAVTGVRQRTEAWRRGLLWAGMAVLVAAPANAQILNTPPSIRGVTKYIEVMEPTSGPAGTEVRVRAEGLRPNTPVFVGIGEIQGCGYEVCARAQTDGRGVLEAVVVVPDWGHHDHYEVVMILDEMFATLAVSDPFHVVDANGLIRRTGRVEVVWPGCPALVTEDGVAYALVGQHVPGLLASEGRAMRVAGRIVPARCTLQNAIEVTGMELAPE